MCDGGGELHHMVVVSCTTKNKYCIRVAQAPTFVNRVHALAAPVRVTTVQTI